MITGGNLCVEGPDVAPRGQRRFFLPARSSSGPRPPRTHQAPPTSHVHHLQQRFPSTPPVFSSAREGSHEERLRPKAHKRERGGQHSTTPRRHASKVDDDEAIFSVVFSVCAPQIVTLGPGNRSHARHLRILISRMKKKKNGYESGRTSNPRRAASGCAAPCKPFLAPSAHTPCSAAIASSLRSGRDHAPRFNGDAHPSHAHCPRGCSVCFTAKETGGCWRPPAAQCHKCMPFGNGTTPTQLGECALVEHTCRSPRPAHGSAWIVCVCVCTVCGGGFVVIFA